MEIQTTTATWFEVKLRYGKTMEDGQIKSATEIYVFDALSWTEAETKALEYIKDFVSGEVEILSIAKASYKEVTFSEGEVWFKAKVDFITLDEKTATEKKQSVTYLVQAKDIANAQSVVNEMFKSGMMDYNISKLVETKILDVLS